MASERKKRKVRSKFIEPDVMKENRGSRCKHINFYTSSYRGALKRMLKIEFMKEEIDGTRDS